MGASTFVDFYKAESPTDTAKKAFSRAVEDAQYEHGHGGYTGTIAEKDSIVHCGSADTRDEAYRLADSLIEKGDSRVDDKWGPAGCIEVKEPKGWVFFGWASD